MENIAKLNQGILDGIPNLSERALMLTVSNNGLVDNMSDYFTGRLKDVRDLFKVNENRVEEIEKKDFNKHTKRLLAEKKDIKEIRDTVKFNNVAKIKVPMMVGLNKNLPEAVMLLQPAIDVIKNHLVDRVNECDDITAKMLADKDFKKSSKPVKIDSKLHAELGLLRKTLNELIDPDGVIDRETIEKVLPNLSSLEGVVDGLAKLGDGNTVKHLDQVQKVTKVTSKRVDALYKEFTTNKDIEVEREKVMVLARYLELTAEYVTTSISLLHIVSQLTNMTTIVIKRLKDNI